MNEPTSSSAAQIDVIRDAYAALNRGDVAGFVRSLDTNVERIEELPSGGTYRGLAAVMKHVADARETWAEGGCEPQRFRVVGDRVIAYVDVRVRLKKESGWREGRTADVFRFRDGKIVEFCTFIDERRAEQWAGLQGSD